MNNKLKIAAIALIAIIAPIAIVYAAVQMNLTVPTSGNITDTGLVASPSSIDWGNIAPGSIVQRQLNITNINMQTSAPLNLTVATTIGSVDWNIESLELPANATIKATITLTVDANASNGPFSFPLYIQG